MPVQHSEQCRPSPGEAGCSTVLVSSLRRECKPIERAGGRAEMALRQMQVEGSDLEVAMAEQDLDGAQVGAGFEKVGGEAVAQRVGMNAPVVETGALGGDLAGRPEDLGGHRLAGCVPAVAGKQPLLGLAPETSPVGAQLFEQLRAEHDVAILAALALANMNHHTLAVDIADLQVGGFRAACAGGIHRHQQDAMKRCIRRLNQSRDFFLTEYPWKVTNLLRIGRLGDTPATLQHVDIEEAQSRQPQDDGVGTVLQLGEQHRLILANVFRTKLIGWAPEMLAEVRHTVKIRADGCIGEVAALQLFKHELT